MNLSRLFKIVSISLSLFAYTTQAQQTHPVTGELLAEQQTFTYNIASEPPSIDPQLVEDVAGDDITRDLFEGLLSQNADGSLAPGVALHWERNNDGTVYTFHLRHNAKWSNGDTVTAHDFVYGWQRSVDPKLASPQAGYLGLMNVKNASKIKNAKLSAESLGVKAIDDFTFEVELEAPISYFTSMLIAATTMPANQKVIGKYADKWTKPGYMVSNGAFVLTEHVLNERMVRVRNKHYWDNKSTLIDKVISLTISDVNQAFNRYLAGELDISNIPTGQYRRLKKEYPDQAHSTPLLCSYYYYFNIDQPPLNDPRVRTALSYAIDRDIITQRILGSGQFPAYTFTPGATQNFIIPDVAYAKISQAERNNKARALLEQAGYNMNNPLQASILYNTSEGHKKIAIAISQMWNKALNAKITLQNQEWKTFLNSRQQGDFQIARSGWCGYYNEPSAFLNLVDSNSEYNDSNYSNPEVDKLLVEAKKLKNPNPNYTRIEEIITRDFPIAPIYHYTSVKMLKPYVKGWPFKNIQNNWYSKELYILAH